MVAPKKEKLAAAEAEYSELMTGLNQKKAELAAVEANLAALNAKLKEMQVSHAVCCALFFPVCLAAEECQLTLHAMRMHCFSLAQFCDAVLPPVMSRAMLRYLYRRACSQKMCWSYSCLQHS